MPVNPRGNGWQAAVHHQGQRYRRDFETKAEATAWEASARAALLKGEMPPDIRAAGPDSAPTSLQALLDMTYARFWRGRPAGDTALVNGNAVIDALGAGLHPNKVDERKLDALVLTLQAKGNSNGTVNRKLAALSKMLTFAFERGYIPRKPKIERLKESEGRLRWVDDPEEKVLLGFFDHIGAEDMVEFCSVCFDTGMRTGEALAFAGSQVSNGLIVLAARQTKNGKARSIPMTQRVADIVARRHNSHPKGPLFHPLTQSAVNHYWNRARDFMDLEEDAEFVPHVMRHTFCSRLAQRGVSAKVIQELAGHSSLIVTQRYMKLAPGNLLAAISVLQAPPSTQQTSV